MKKTTYTDSLKPECQRLQYTTDGCHSQFGRSYTYITCPFCRTTTRAYLWSPSGSGKRCSCGALLGTRGLAYKMPEPGGGA